MGNHYFCILLLPCLFIGWASPASILKNVTTNNSREKTSFDAETPVTEYGNQSVIDTRTCKVETVKVDSNSFPESEIPPLPRPEARGGGRGGGGGRSSGGYRGYRGGGGGYHGSGSSGGSSKFPWIPVIALSSISGFSCIFCIIESCCWKRAT